MFIKTLCQTVVFTEIARDNEYLPENGEAFQRQDHLGIFSEFKG